MPLTTEILKQDAHNLKITVVLQEELIREVLITNEFKKPLLFALTTNPDLKTQSSRHIWNLIKNDLFIGETIQSLGYRINKINKSHEKALIPDWLKNLIGSTDLIYDAYTYDLLIQKSKNVVSTFATITEIILDKSLNKLMNYEAENNARTIELNNIVKNIYQLLKINKEPIVFF